MAATSTNHRPYGPTAGVIALCERARTRNLHDRINDDFFRLAGITGQSIRRTRQTLVFLGLLDDDGGPTDALHALAAAPDSEWRSFLQSAVETAYASDLENVDPAKDDLETIRSWFQRYEPRSQTVTMTSLFLGLCRECGMEVKEAPRSRRTAGRQSSSSTGSTNKADRSSAGRTKSSQQQPAIDASQADALSSIPNGLFDITSEIIGELDDAGFEKLWDALGVIAQTKARVLKSKSAESSPGDERTSSVD